MPSPSCLILASTADSSLGAVRSEYSKMKVSRMKAVKMLQHNSGTMTRQDRHQQEQQGYIKMALCAARFYGDYPQLLQALCTTVTTLRKWRKIL